MNRLTRKNQKSTPAQTLAKTKSAMLRLASPQLSQPTTTVSKGIAANLGRALLGTDQRVALPVAAEPLSPVISKVDELRRIRNMPITNALEKGETELQRQLQRSAVLAQAQKTLEAELAKLTPTQRAEYKARNAQRVAAISSTQPPPSSQPVSFSPQQSRRR